MRTSRHAPDGGGDTDQHRKPPTHNQRRGQTEPLATREGVRACSRVRMCVLTVHACACTCVRVRGPVCAHARWEKQNAAEVTSNEAISHECQQEGKEASFREGAFCLTHAASPVPCAEREGPLRGSEGTLGVAGWAPDTLSPRSAATWTLGKCTRARVQLGGTATQAQATQPRRFSGASSTKCATQAPEWGGAPAPTPRAASRELPACSAAVLTHRAALTACRGSGCSVLAVTESRRGSGSASASGQPVMLRGASCSIMRWQGGRGALGSQHTPVGTERQEGCLVLQASTQSRHGRAAPSPLPHDGPPARPPPWEPWPRVSLELPPVGLPWGLRHPPPGPRA